MFDIKQRREELGLDQRDIAEACGVAVSTVSRWESGDIENMKRSYITKLADVLGVDSEEILSGTNSDSNTSYQKFLNIASASQNNEQNYNIKGVFNYGDSDNWLRSARIERGYTQTDMAEKLGIKTSSYCQYETKKTQRRLNAIYRCKTVRSSWNTD